MAIHHEIDTNVRTLYIYCEGKISIPQLAVYLSNVIKDALYDKVEKALYDFRKVEFFEFDYTCIKQLFELTEGIEQMSAKPRAVVVDSDLNYGFARMAAGYGIMYGMKLNIFTDFKIAKEWLSHI